MLVGLNELLERPLEYSILLSIAGGLGSDVPFGLVGGPFALGWERGRRLLPLRPPPVRPVLIAVPPFGVSAADAYRWLATDRNPADPGSTETVDSDAGLVLPQAEDLAGWDVLDRLVCNDLEAPVFRRHPELRVMRDDLLERGARHAVLCGSGSCIAAIFDSEEMRDRVAPEFEHRAGVRTIRTVTQGPDAG